MPVAAGAGDQAAGALGVGVDRPGPASIVLGTSGVVFAASDAFAADEARARARLLPRGAGRMAQHGRDAVGRRLAALAARHVRARGELLRRSSARPPRWEPGVEGLTFLPYLAGERTPHADPDARGAFTGLSLRHDRGALVRAVLEGVAFGLRDGLDLVVRVCPPRPARSAASRAAARAAALWLRILASVLELPLQRTAVDEGASFGAALLGGVAAGIFADVHEAVAACVRPGEIVDPVAEWIEPYREARRRFVALYPALHPRA